MKGEQLKRILTAGSAFLAAYVLLDLVSYVKPYGSFGVTPWNPQVGLSMALAYLSSTVAPPFFLMAHFVANSALRSGPMGFWLDLSTSLLSGAVFLSASIALRRMNLIDPRLHSIRDVFNLLLVILAAAMVYAVLFTSILALTGELARGDFGHVARRLFIGDVIGCLTITPLLLIAATQRPWPTPRLEGQALHYTSA